jgi:hypothetical protein
MDGGGDLWMAEDQIPVDEAKAVFSTLTCFRSWNSPATAIHVIVPLLEVLELEEAPLNNRSSPGRVPPRTDP